MPDHKQVEMENPFTKEKVPIDVGMKKLIQGLWDHWIETKECCQENGRARQAYIVFKSGWDFMRFIRFVVYAEMKGFTHWEYHDGWNVKFNPEMIPALEKIFQGGRRSHT